MMLRFPAIALLVSVILSGCSATGPVRTLPEKGHTVVISAGAHFINGESSSVPYIAAGYYHGIAEGFTLGGNLYPMMLLSGSIGADVTAFFRVTKQESPFPEVTVGIGTYYFLFEDGGGGSNNFTPFAKVIGSYSVSKSEYVFFGVENDFSKNFSKVIFTPSIGIRTEPTSGKGAQLEIKWMMFGGASLDSHQSGSFELGLNPKQIAVFFGLFI